MLTLFKNFEIVNFIPLSLTIIVKGLWLNSEQTTEEAVINKLPMELWVQILPGLEAKRYKRLRRIISNAADNSNVGNR